MTEEDEIGAVTVAMGETIAIEVMVALVDMAVAVGEAAAVEVMVVAEATVIVVVELDSLFAGYPPTRIILTCLFNISKILAFARHVSMAALLKLQRTDFFKLSI